MLVDILILALTFSLFFYGGSFFLQNHLTKTHNSRNTLVQTVFAATFALSCTLFELVIFEILDIMGRQYTATIERLISRSRWLLWKLTLVLTLVVLIAVLPMYQIHLIVVGENKGTAAPQLELTFRLAEDPLDHNHRLLLGCLSLGVLEDRPVTDLDIRATEKRYEQVVDLILEKKQRLVDLTETNAVLGQNIFRRFINKVAFTMSTSEADRKIDNPSAPFTLENASALLLQEIDDLIIERERFLFSQTWKGLYFNILGYLLSFYCIYRIFIAIANIFSNRGGSIDPVTQWIGLAVHYLNVQFDVDFWSQQISFLLVGSIIIASVRSFLVQLMKVGQSSFGCLLSGQLFQMFSHIDKSNVMVLFIAQVMGMYFVSSLLMLRLSLPLQYRRIITEILKGIQLDFYHRWFEVIFLLSALASTIFLYFLSPE